MNKETETPDVANEQSTEVDTRSDIERELERVESIEVELRGDGEQGEAKASVAPADEAPVKAPAPPPVAEEKTVNRKEVIMDQMRNNMAGSTAKPKKLSAGIAVLSVLVVALLGAIGWLVFDKMRVDSELSNARQSLSVKEGQISSLSSKSSSSSADAKEAAKPSAQVADKTYRAIPGWNVKYKVSNAAKDEDLVYSLTVKDHGELLEVHSLKALRLKAPGITHGTSYPCGESSLGVIIRYTGPQLEAAAKESLYGSDLKQLAKKVGEHYYHFTGTTPNCMGDPSLAANQKEWFESSKYVGEIVKNLEVSQ